MNVIRASIWAMFLSALSIALATLLMSSASPSSPSVVSVKGQPPTSSMASPYAAASAALNNKSKGRKAPKAKAKRPGLLARIKSKLTGRSKSNSAAPSAGSGYNPLVGIPVNRAGRVLAGPQLPARTAPPPGAGQRGIVAPHGRAPYVVTNSGQAQGSAPPARATPAGRAGALAAPATAPTLTSTAPVPKARAGNARPARKAYLHEIPNNLQRPKVQRTAQTSTPRRTGDYQSVSQLLSSRKVDAQGRPDTIIYESLPPSKIVYGRLPSDPGTASADPGPSSQRTSVRLRTYFQKLDADARQLTGVPPPKPPRPARGYTAAPSASATTTPSVARPRRDPRIFQELPARPGAGGIGVRNNLSTVNHGLGAAPTLQPAQTKPIEAYFI